MDKKVIFARTIGVGLIPYLAFFRLRRGRFLLVTSRVQRNARFIPFLQRFVRVETVYFHISSPAGIRASRDCLAAVDNIFQRYDLNSKFYSAVKFFENEDAYLLLKKLSALTCEETLRDLYGLQELSLRRNWQVDFIVLEPIEQILLERQEALSRLNKDKVSWPLYQFLRHKLIEYGYLLFILVRCVVLLPWGRGVSFKRAVNREYLYAVDNQMGLHRDEARNDTFLVDDKNIKKEQVLVLLTGANPATEDYYRAVGFQAENIISLRTTKLKVGLVYWLRTTVKFISACSSFFNMRASTFYAFMKTEFLVTIYRSIKWDLLFENIGIKVLLITREYGEYTYQPILQYLAAEKYDVRTIIIPTVQVDQEGALSSFYGASITCTPGDYLPANYSKTWLKQMAVKKVGILVNSGAFINSSKVGDMLQAKAAGNPVIAVLTDEDPILTDRESLHYNLLALVIKILEELPNVCIVVKYKGTKTASQLFLHGYDAKLNRHIAENRLIVLEPGDYSVSPQALAPHADLILSSGGSVGVEMLGLKKPSFVIVDNEHTKPMPIKVADQTPFVRRFWNKVFFDDVGLAFNAVENFLKIGAYTLDENDWAEIWTMFDRFHDGQAITRLRRIILETAAATDQPDLTQASRSKKTLEGMSI